MPRGDQKSEYYHKVDRAKNVLAEALKDIERQFRSHLGEEN